MISVSRFKKVFLILTAFVCVTASVSMKAKADYEPMNVLKTSSLNTAMPQVICCRYFSLQIVEKVLY